MKVTLESTTKVVTASGLLCRLWEGETESGIKVVAFIVRIAAGEGADLAQFEEELLARRSPSPEADAIPLRMIL